MNILGIDTSCDDTSASVVADGNRVLSSVVASQIGLHHPYGGVVPELASREHVRSIVPVVNEALDMALMGWKDLQGIAVTIGPGLSGSLLVGLNYARGAAYACRIPLVGINHLEGHILSIFLEERHPDFPFVALTVSGGHTSLTLVRGFGEYTLLGQTLDDAAGEAFDKVAKILGLGYPGGRAIEKAALSGDEGRIAFPKAFLSRGSLDFSFSGLKTAVALYVKRWSEGVEGTGGVAREDIASSFQEAVVEVLVHKTLCAAERAGVGSIVVAGGVACNRKLREKMEERASKGGREMYSPRPAYCTDNGAMIALAGYHRRLRKEECDLDVDVKSRFPLEDLAASNP